MSTKIEREKAALQQAEADLAERRKRLEEMEKEEAEKKVARLVKKVGQDRAIGLLELAVELKPKVALSILQENASKPTTDAQATA